MLTSRKPGPPVPPRPSAAAVATALAKHRENHPPTQNGIHTLKPPHPGRTVVYKSPGYDQPPKKPQSVVLNGSGSYNGSDLAHHTFKNDSDHSFGKTEVYVGEPNSGGYLVPRPVLPVANRNTVKNNSSTNLEKTKLIYTSTCSIIEINSSSSASTSASTSPMSTLQKTESKTNLNSSSSFSSGRSSANDSNHLNSADEEDTVSSHKLKLSNSFNNRPLNRSERGSTIKLNSPEVIVINGGNPLEYHDSGTEQNSIDTNSIASSNSLERENNFKNRDMPRKPHLTEIFIGSNDETVVSNGGIKTIIEARNDILLKTPIHLPYDPPKPVLRTSSIRLPYRPEPEGGEHTTPIQIDSKPSTKIPDLNNCSKLSAQKKLDFHELLISELAQMRGKRQAVAAPEVSRSPTGSSPSGTVPRASPRIRTSDWIEVGDNGKQVVLSSCQISLEDSGMEDEGGGKHEDEDGEDDLSSGVGDSWNSVKDDDERITMSLPGLPPLPKSLSGFDLAGQQLQSHQQHYYNLQPPSASSHAQQQEHQSQEHSAHHQHHQPPSSASSSLHPHPPHQPPPPPPTQQQSQSQYNNHQQQPSFNHHPTNPFIPINPANAAATVANLQSVSMASLVSQQQQRGQSPVSTVSSSGNSIVATPNSGNSGSGGSGGSGSAVVARKATTTLDTQLAVLRREMVSTRNCNLHQVNSGSRKCMLSLLFFK
ncbi:uncharacterized protein LOC129749612 [Uranotaenia lowii]|uniref:uncharacterized protein LOC129749612 n=1 Tax=Uranotaenia lowii TaxID=190385 RepID=UPI00247A4734|nr:uncharacterized protein LOC129749612 [Uranotaenia lowii]